MSKTKPNLVTQPQTSRELAQLRNSKEFTALSLGAQHEFYSMVAKFKTVAQARKWVAERGGEVAKK